MHPEAFEWVREHATLDTVSVLDIGGRDVNGSPRWLFPNAYIYTVLDIEPGEGVDIVVDAATWEPDQGYDVVLSTECFEHAKAWRDIIDTAYRALNPRGRFIATMAGPGRPLHSGIDGGPELHDGEWYENVDPADLQRTLESVGFQQVHVDQWMTDVRCIATK